MGLAVIWGVCGSLVFTGLYAFYWALGPNIPPPLAKALLISFGVWGIHFAVLLAGALLYHQARTRKLAPLRALEVALRAEESS
jgi:hypothetical protein